MPKKLPSVRLTVSISQAEKQMLDELMLLKGHQTLSSAIQDSIRRYHEKVFQPSYGSPAQVLAQRGITVKGRVPRSVLGDTTEETKEVHYKIPTRTRLNTRDQEREEGLEMKKLVCVEVLNGEVNIEGECKWVKYSLKGQGNSYDQEKSINFLPDDPEYAVKKMLIDWDIDNPKHMSKLDDAIKAGKIPARVREIIESLQKELSGKQQ